MKAIQLITFVSLFFTLLIFSCGKKDDPAPSGGGSGSGGNAPACETNRTLSLEIINNSPNDYNVSYNSNERISVPGGASRYVTANVNSSIRAVQQNGIISTYGAADLILNYYGSSCSNSTVTIKSECETFNFSSLNLINNSNNPYRVTYDNEVLLADVPGNSTVNVVIPSGFRTLKATQRSGFLFTPTIREASFSPITCSNYNYTFPN